MEEHNDLEIIEEHIAGNEKAFAVLVNRYFKIVYRYSLSWQKDSTLAEDATQETFLKVWKKLNTFDTAGSFKSWILRITRNTNIDILRKKKSFNFTELGVNDEDNFVESIESTDPLPDEVFAHIEDKEVLRSMLENLSLQEREVIRLRYGEDMSFEEIANVLDKNLNTVKSLNRRGLLKLRELKVQLNYN